MTTIVFDVAAFRTLFPAFANTTDYPTPTLDLYWASATLYITDQFYAWCGGLSIAQQTYAINLMTAHLAALNAAAASGTMPGFTTSSTIDKISVQVQAPPANTEWQWWLNQTPYGAQLYALLQVAGAGGFYFGGGGSSPKLAFRN